VKEEKVFVTGGAGFIGSSLVRQLIDGGRLVTVYDNLSTGAVENLPPDKSMRFVEGDVRDFGEVCSVMKGHEFVVHLAAQAFVPRSYSFPIQVSETNTIGSLNVFIACLKNKVKRVVHVSSSEVYGTAENVPIDERQSPNPASTYAVSKLAADLSAQTMACEHKLPVVIVRPFNTFGPRDTCPRFIPEAIRQCIKEPVVLVGNTKSSRDYTYIQDTARAIVLALEKEGTDAEVINIGTGKAFEMSGILEMIKHYTGNEDKEILLDAERLRPNDPPVLISSTTKASKLLGWKPEVEFTEGLRNTIRWYLRNGKTWAYEKRSWNEQRALEFYG